MSSDMSVVCIITLARVPLFTVYQFLGTSRLWTDCAVWADKPPDFDLSLEDQSTGLTVRAIAEESGS